MTHASLCKRTHKRDAWFQGSGSAPAASPISSQAGSPKDSKTRAVGSFCILALLFLAAGNLLGQLRITTTSLPDGVIGLPYLTAQGNPVQLAASGGNGNPFSWSFFSFSPNTTAGLTFAATGIISGIPSTLGTLSFGVAVSDGADAGGAANGQLQITVLPCPPSLTPASPLPQGDINTPYPQITFTISGCPGSTYTFSEQPIDPFSPNTLPPGLNLTPSGTLKGTPSSAGTFSFYITLT